MSSVSVILSTYNGERYLLPLLDSLRAQTRQPDEVLVLDDASSDGTVSLVRDYIAEHGLGSWKLEASEENRGWKANFRRGILACSGDLVFPCDQDDIWDGRKVELMAAAMEEHPEVDLLACQVEPFYEGRNETYRTDSMQSGGKLVDLVGLDGSDFLYVMRPGCAYCVRSAFAHDIEPWWKPSYPHDATLWRFAAITRSLALYERPLVRFRRHGDNASSRGYVTREIRLSEVEYYIDFFGQVRGYLEEKGRMTGELETLIVGLERWLEARRKLLSGHRSAAAFKTVFAGRQWYSTWKSPLVDTYFAFNREGRLHA